ncbi:MAG: DUF5788 family protein [Thermoplasmata archaeon]|nr:DUF5788 family protein [Thermoplasmata archaeon]
MADSGPAPGQGSVDARALLTPEDRAKMIARIHSLVYWVGMLIPEREVLGDTEIDLREVVYDLTNKDQLTPEDVARVNELIRLLKERERSLEHSLAHDPMTLDAAKELLEEICGLLRAIDELRSVETTEKAEFRKAEMMSRIEDAKRWQKFVESRNMG